MEPLHRILDYWYVNRTDNSQHTHCKCCTLRARDCLAQCNLTKEQKEQNQNRYGPSIPDPPCSPSRFSPNDSRYQCQRSRDTPNRCNGSHEDVGHFGAPNDVHHSSHGRCDVDNLRQMRCGHMKEHDAKTITLKLLRRHKEQSPHATDYQSQDSNRIEAIHPNSCSTEKTLGRQHAMQCVREEVHVSSYCAIC